MATEILFANGTFTTAEGWSGNGTDIDEGISAADGNEISSAADGEGDVVRLDFNASALTDADTITAIEVFIRGRVTTDGTDESFFLNVVIDGSPVQAAQTAILTDSHTTLSIDLGSWGQDWTAAQMDGIQLDIYGSQSGMPDPNVWHIDCVELLITYTPSGGGPDVLLADDLESLSLLTTPVVGQEHVLLADNADSVSELTTPVVGQEHVLLSNSVESASEVTTPTVIESNILLADNVESASEVTAPPIGQEHVLGATDVESLSVLTTPVVGQEHVLGATDTESASEVGVPVVGQEHVLLSNSVQSASELTTPVVVDLGGVDVLLADDVDSLSELTTPVVGQEHVLLSNSADSVSELTTPVVVDVSGDDDLLAEDVDSASELTTPSLGQEHVLLADDAESASVLTTPVLAIVGAVVFTNLMDAILGATGGPSINEGLATWFSKTSTESLQDAERRWLLALPATSSGTNQDLWVQYLTSLGHTGTINEKQFKYWNSQ